MTTGIYEIRNTANGKRYIGSAKNFRQRWCEHRTELNRGDHVNKHLLAAWRKYGPDAFVFKRLLICSLEHLVMFEQRVMDGLHPEYNKTPKAGSSLGFRHTEETKKKIGDMNRGRVPSVEERQKMSMAGLGRPKTAEHRAKISKTRIELKLPVVGMAACCGWKHSPEVCAKISAANKGRKMPPRSAEHRAKISAIHKGKTVSLETRAKLSAAARRRFWGISMLIK